MCFFETEIFFMNSTGKVSKIYVKLTVVCYFFLQNIAQGIFPMQFKLHVPVSEIWVFAILLNNGCIIFFLLVEFRYRY